MPIDIHAHYVPPQLLEAITSRGADVGVKLIPSPGDTPPAMEFSYGFKVRPFFRQLVETAQQRKTWLDEKGLSLQVVSTWPDIFGYGLPPEACAGWHRMLNDTLAEWCAEHADRFAWLGSVPMPDAKAAAAEAQRQIGLGAVGIQIAANVEGVNIGELPLDPFWETCVAHDIPILMHPVVAGPMPPRASKFALAQVVQYTYDTTLAVGSMIQGGVLDRFPGLKLILAHGGGSFPYLSGRFDLMHTRMDRAAQHAVAKEPPSAYASRLYYDSICHAPKPLKFLIDLVGLDRIMIGTDYSFPPADLDPLDSLRAAGLTKVQVETVGEGNARAVFSRLKA